MNLFKRAAAALLSVCMLLTCVSCGENTAVAMTIDGYDIRAGIYLYYVISAYNDAIDVLIDGGESFEDCETIKDIKKIVSKVDIDGVSAEEWIQNKAAEYCASYVAIEKEFDRLELTLSGSDLAAADSSLASSMAYLGEFFYDTGIGEQSVKDIILSSYKQSALWDAYYGEGGLENVPDEELYQYYADNHFRIKYIEMPLTDGEGNLLKADGKEEIENMANDYLARLAKKSGSEKDLMEEFDYLIEEHAEYVTSLSNAAVTTTDDEGNTITTATTTKTTTTDPDESEETTTAAPDETGDTTETTTAAADTTGDVTDETTEAAETTTADVTTEETETTTTTTGTGIPYDTANERVLTVITSAEDDSDDDSTTQTEISYTPCEAVYNWAVDPDTEYLKPELIKDNECYYVVVKMNIEDRMTSGDLWSDSAKESVRQELYYEDFLDMMQDQADELTIDKNEKAFKRYKVLDVDIIAYQSALYMSYYSMYGLS